MQERAPNASFKTTLATLWRCRTYKFTVSFFVVNGFATMGLLQWWPSFYGRIFDISLTSVGILLGLAVGTGSGLGAFLGGIVAHQAAKRNISLPLTLSAGSMCLALPAAFGSLFVSSAYTSMCLAGVAILLWSVPMGPAHTALYSAIRPTMRATASALTIFSISILGFGLGPFCVGVLSEFLTSSFGEQSLRYALVLPALFLLGPAIALYAISRTLPQDLRLAGAAT